MSDTDPSSDDEGASLFGGNLAALESNAKRHLLELGSALADTPDAPAAVAPNLAADEPTPIPISSHAAYPKRPVSGVSTQNKRADRESHSPDSPRLPLKTKAIPPHRMTMPSSLPEQQDVWATRPWATASRMTMPMPLQEQQVEDADPLPLGRGFQVVDGNSKGSGSLTWQMEWEQREWEQSSAPTQMQAQQGNDAEIGTRTSPPPPDQASVRLEWAQVKYFQSDTGEWKLDSKNAPCNPPFDGMKFKGYNIPKDRSTVEAFFVRIGASARRPNRTGGGVNKNFHDALAHAKKHGEDIEDLKKRLTYVSKVRRTHGVNDPEI